MTAHANLTHLAERIDMAAAFQWTAKLNMHESVANHFSLAVNPEGTRFLINPNGRHFARIRASDLLELDANDPGTMNRPDAPDPTAWGLHGSIPPRPAPCALRDACAFDPRHGSGEPCRQPPARHRPEHRNVPQPSGGGRPFRRHGFCR